jgi:hypothetical protein
MDVRQELRNSDLTFLNVFFGPSLSIGKQQVAILSKYQAQAAWAEPWKSMNGVDPPRGFAFAWFKIGNEEIGVYSLHLKSNLITHGDIHVWNAVEFPAHSPQLRIQQQTLVEGGAAVRGSAPRSQRR